MTWDVRATMRKKNNRWPEPVDTKIQYQGAVPSKSARFKKKRMCRCSTFAKCWFKQWSWNKFAQQGAAECSDPHWQKIEATTRAPEHGWNRRKVITNTDTSPRWSEGSPTSWFDNRAHSRVVREGVNPKQTHLQKWGELICTLHFTVHQLNSLQSWSFASFLFSLQVSWYTGARKSSGFHK